MKFILSFSALLALAPLANAQPGRTGLYMPLEFQKAYDKGTRKTDGSVSATYWQNSSDYKLKARIDPSTKILYGEGVITYHNNSPDSITRIVFHTYADYYRRDSRHNGPFSGAKTAETDGMVITKLSLDGKICAITNKDRVTHNGTNYSVKLTKKLPPGSSLKIEASWHYEIAGKGFERSGAIDSTSMFIGYWYPEMSVCDDIEGWDRTVYDASTEFYHDYSNYEVEITAPDNFIVWASVPPVNPSEVYSPIVQARLAKARKSTEAVSIYSAADFHKGNKALTWKYTAKEFPDFAFALSDHFLWDAASYKDSFGEYFINTAYPAGHDGFKAVLKTMSKSLEILHTAFPAYAFPFTHFVIFNGLDLDGAGIEYPGMANDALASSEGHKKITGIDSDDFSANLPTSLHEMCHMYFPFLLGTNEKKYAWMEEGMATFSESFNEQYIRPDAGPGRQGDRPFLGSLYLMPVMVPSWTLQRSGYPNSYIVSVASYNSLYRLLGRDLFLKCLHGYMNEWKHKHPTPYDFMNTFNRISGKDLTWFWKRWYFDWGYLDMAIKDFSNDVLTIENRGGRPIAIELIVRYSDGSSERELVNPSVWENSSVYTQKMDRKKEIASIRIEPELGPDALSSNNSWPVE